MPNTLAVVHVLLLSTGALLLCPFVAAQDAVPASAPATYIRIDKSKSFDDMAISLYRDGPREMIEMTRAANAAHPKGWRSRMWLDFTAHRQYAVDSNAPGKCSVIKYTSDGPPPLLDRVVGAAEIPTGIKPSGTQTLGSVKTSVFEAGPEKLWVDQTHHLIIKLVLAMRDGQPKVGGTPQTMFDLTGIRFDKPDPALLSPPTHCKQIAGKSNANGGHAEVGAQVHSGAGQ